VPRLALLAVAGCSRARPPGQEEGEPPVPRSAAEIVLPLDTYQETAAQRLTAAKAEDLLGQACMRRFGFDWQLPQRVPSRRNDNARRDGIFDERHAATYGYHPLPDPAHTAAVTMWTGKGPSQVNGHAVPPGGCLGEAEVAYQQRLIERHAEALAEAKRLPETRSGNAAKVLAGGT
jgi:hypothetical protein